MNALGAEFVIDSIGNTGVSDFASIGKVIGVSANLECVTPEYMLRVFIVVGSEIVTWEMLNSGTERRMRAVTRYTAAQVPSLRGWGRT